MFDAISKGFRQARNRLAGLTELTEENIDSALREVRLSLLEADVELGVVKAFLARVKDDALGEVVRIRAKGSHGQSMRVGASEQFVKICHDALVDVMAASGPAITFASAGTPTGIMMVGLQGSGKTTSCAKLARYLCKQGKKVLLVACDMQRPAAVQQLQVLGASIDVPVFAIEGAAPLEISQKALEEAKRSRCDAVIYDTAGRLAIDELLMNELSAIQEAIHPENRLLVIDSMIGQDAVKVSKGFHERLNLTGVILTKLDGDARGGAALSVREITGAPVRFVGMGEGTDKLEEFRPEGMASRVLGMGDVVGLMKDFEEVVDEEKAAEDAMRMLQGQFTLDDFLNQIRMIQQMGSLKDLVGKLPGMSDMIPADANLDDRELSRIEAMIQSFTKHERTDPLALVREPRRVTRIARGSGHSEKDVNEFVQKFSFIRQMMGGFGQNLGLMGKIPGMKNLAKLRNLQKNVGKMGGLPGMGGTPFPGMGGMPGFDGMPGFGGGFGGGSLTKMKTMSTAEKNAKKAQRKREKDARRKGRK